MTERKSFSYIPAFILRVGAVCITARIGEYKLDLKFRRREAAKALIY